MITARQFLHKDKSEVFNEQDILQAMIEFAKIHVKEALETASVKVGYNIPGFPATGINERSILKAYPLHNIK